MRGRPAQTGSRRAGYSLIGEYARSPSVETPVALRRLSAQTGLPTPNISKLQAFDYILHLFSTFMTDTSLTTGGGHNTGDTTLTPTTDESLLDAIGCDPDSDRLGEFARIYEPVMRRYAIKSVRKLGGALSGTDAEDIVQEAFISVRRAMGGFKYDTSRGRFRNYLSLTIRNISFRFARGRKAMRPVEPRMLEAIADSNAATPGEAGAESDRDIMLSIWGIAYAIVTARRNFSPNTQAIFRSHVLDGIPVEEVAEEFKTTTNAVYQIKDRILRAVRNEIGSASHPGASLDEIREVLFERSKISAQGC